MEDMGWSNVTKRYVDYEYSQIESYYFTKTGKTDWFKTAGCLSIIIWCDLILLLYFYPKWWYYLCFTAQAFWKCWLGNNQQALHIHKCQNSLARRRIFGHRGLNIAPIICADKRTNMWLWGPAVSTLSTWCHKHYNDESGAVAGRSGQRLCLDECSSGPPSDHLLVRRYERRSSGVAWDWRDPQEERRSCGRPRSMKSNLESPGD